MRMPNFNDEIRRLYISRPKFMKEVRPTKQEIDAFRLIEGGAKTSNEVAKKMGVSTPHASNLLGGLFDKGYLWRDQVGDQTGGVMYEYTTRI